MTACDAALTYTTLQHDEPPMPINSEWVNPQKSLIFAKLEGKVSSQEVLAYDEQIRAMLAEVTHPVDLIMDYSRQVYFDAEYAQTAQKLKAFERANLRLVVWVQGEIAWALFEAFSREYGGYPFQAVYAATLEEAHEYVRIVSTGGKLNRRRPPDSQWN